MSNKKLVYDIETITPRFTGEPGVFPPLTFHEIVTIAIVLEEEGSITYGNIRGNTEKELIGNFIQLIDDNRPELVSFNGRGFDLPCVLLRCLKYGLVFSRYGDYSHRYNSKHTDLYDLMNNYGASRNGGLDPLANLIGLPGKGAMDGSQVNQYVSEGRIKEVEDYCLLDSIQTYLLYNDYHTCIGEMDKADYLRIVDFFSLKAQTDKRLECLKLSHLRSKYE